VSILIRSRIGIFPYFMKFYKNLDDSCPTSLLRINYFLEKTHPRCFRTETFKDSPLHLASKFGKPNILKYLLTKDETTSKIRIFVAGKYVSSEEIVYGRHESHFPVAGKLNMKGQLLFFVPTTLNANRQTCLHLIPNESKVPTRFSVGL